MPPITATEPKFKMLGILKLDDLFEFESLLFVFDYLMNNLPNSFHGIFPMNSDMPNSRETRQSNLLYVPHYTRKFSQKLPAYFLPSLWNTWSRSFPDNISRFQIKHFIKKTKLHDYAQTVMCKN